MFGSDGTRGFFARSKVEKLWIRKGILSMAQLQPCPLPDLKVLVLDSCRMQEGRVFKSPGSYIWFIHESMLNWSDLNRIAESCPPRLVISELRVIADDPVYSEKGLDEAFPTAEFVEIGSCLDRTADWDVLAPCVFSDY